MFEIKQDKITKDYFVYEDGHFICMTAESKENAERIVRGLELLNINPNWLTKQANR